MATTVKFTKDFDYYKPGETMTAYSAKGGENGDGVYENVPDAHAKAANEAGFTDAKPPAVEGVKDTGNKSPGK